jgi:hypothetical protein
MHIKTQNLLHFFSLKNCRQLREVEIRNEDLEVAQRYRETQSLPVRPQKL